MKRVILSTVTLSFLAVSAYALDMQKAVDVAIENNNILKEQNYIVKESKQNIISAKASKRPTVDLGYSYDEKSKTNSFQTKHDSSFNATVSYNLFDGFAKKYNIKSAQNNLAFSKNRLTATKHDVILQVKDDYIAYLKNRRNTIVQQNAVQLFQKQYDDSKNFYDQGVKVALNNLLEVEIELLQAKQLLLKSKSAQKIAKEKLFTTIGLTLNETIDEVKLSEDENILESLNLKLLDNRSELMALQMSKESLINQKKVIKGNYYPKVDASLAHKRYGDDLLLNGKDGSYDPQTVGTVSLSWNLYNGGKDESNMVVYRHKISQVNSQIQDLKSQIQLQYSKAKEQYVLTSENLKISKKALEQSRVNYEIVDNRFKEGISTSKNLIDANYLLTQAQVNYYSVYYDKILAKATLNRVFEK